MPTPEQLRNLHTALTSRDLDAARQIVSEGFAPVVQETLERNPSLLLSRVEAIAQQSGVPLERGGATRSFAEEPAGFLQGAKRGIQQASGLGTGFLGLGAPQGAPPIQTFPGAAGFATGAALPLAAGFLGAPALVSKVAAPAIRSIAAGSRLAPFLREPIIGALHGLTGVAGELLPALITGQSGATEALKERAGPAAVLGAAAPLARRALPGGGAIRRGQETSRVIRRIRHGIEPKRLKTMRSLERRVIREGPGVESRIFAQPKGAIPEPAELLPRGGVQGPAAEAAAQAAQAGKSIGEMLQPENVLGQAIPETTKAARAPAGIIKRTTEEVFETTATAGKPARVKQRRRVLRTGPEEKILAREAPKTPTTPKRTLKRTKRTTAAKPKTTLKKPTSKTKQKPKRKR